VTWGEIYRTRERVSERGHKPGFYAVVSRDFIAGNDDISTVICAPVYSEILGLRSEVAIGVDEGVPRRSAIRCDFLTLMFKAKLTGFVATLSLDKQAELRRALGHALQLDR
jgi:mRNA interferase MazF